MKAHLKTVMREVVVNRPVDRIVLTMSRDEATYLRAIVGSIGGQSAARNVLNQVYNHLTPLTGHAVQSYRLWKDTPVLQANITLEDLICRID